MSDSPSRRDVLVTVVGACAAPMAGCAGTPPPQTLPPIVFVPGNGASAALWTTTLWRFESNGWPRDRLHAMDIPYPTARDDDSREQPGRSSTAEHMAGVAAAVKRVLAATGASRVVLVGNSRGGYAIRNFVANGGGAALVSHVVLGGVPNHGVFIDPRANLGNEFNGAGPFLMALNSPPGAEDKEVEPGIAWLTIRSDNNDKYAQPDGVWIDARGTPTNVTFDGPALKGAENVVLPGADHHETSYSARAFEHTFRFITGRAPATLAIAPESRVVLDGIVSGSGIDNRQGSDPSNLPLASAMVEVFATRAGTGERAGPAVHAKTIGSDGRWGPFVADGAAVYEIVIAAPGYATTHVYRGPFPRSSAIVSLRPERLADADRDAQSIVVFTRPRGYFGVPRDRIVLDGSSPPAGIPSGVAGVSSTRLKVTDGAPRSVAGEFNGERIVGRTWPVAGNHATVLELTF